MLRLGLDYLGIRIAVEHIPPTLMCATLFCRGALHAGYCVATGRSIRYSWRQLGQIAVVGILLLMGGNLTLSYAEQYVPFGNCLAASCFHCAFGF